MEKEDYYKVHQANINMLKEQMEIVKEATQANLGKLLFFKEKEEAGKVESLKLKVKANTRLYMLLVCSWLEVRLEKILYEDSRAAFSATQIDDILRKKTMDQKWKSCFNIAVCKSFDIYYDPKLDDLSEEFSSDKDRYYYVEVKQLIKDIESAITIRNRLAHGQMNIQMNQKKTKVKQYPLLEIYDNVQKITFLQKNYEHIADIINMYVTFKDKEKQSFYSQVEKKIKLIEENYTRVEKSDFQAYAKQFLKIEKKRNEVWRKYNIKN